MRFRNRRRCRPPATCGRRLVGVGGMGPRRESVWRLQVGPNTPRSAIVGFPIYRTDRRMNETKRETMEERQRQGGRERKRQGNSQYDTGDQERCRGGDGSVVEKIPSRWARGVEETEPVAVKHGRETHPPMVRSCGRRTTGWQKR